MPQTRDIVVIGGSGSSLDALRPILACLPGDLPAALFVVIHVGAVSYLASVLGRTSALPVLPAESGVTIERSKVYVAGPGARRTCWSAPTVAAS